MVLILIVLFVRLAHLDAWLALLAQHALHVVQDIGYQLAAVLVVRAIA